MILGHRACKSYPCLNLWMHASWITRPASLLSEIISCELLTCFVRYAFDITTCSGQPFLTNRRLFAMADSGIPDGIKCDIHGNVYSGCGDGLNIWSPGGVLLAKILVEGGVANFCFGRDGQLFLLNETRLWRAQIAEGCKGALLAI